MICAFSKVSDQPAHNRSLIRAFTVCLNILWILSYWPEQHLEFLNLKGGYTGSSESIHLPKYHIIGNHMSQLNNFEITSLIKQKNVEMWCENYNNISILQAPIPDSSMDWEFLDVTITANPGRDPYKPLWKFLPNLLIIFQYYFQIQ